MPGPGTYEWKEGTCRDSRRASLTSGKFSSTNRAQAAKVFAGNATLEFVCSPGPCSYDIKSTVGARAVKAKASAAFGRERGQQYLERMRPSTTPSPGPGEYTCKVASLARASKFGSSGRKSADRQYPGPGMPVYSRPDNPSFAGQQSSIGGSTTRPSSPAFSFGARGPTLPREKVNSAEHPWTPHGKRGVSRKRSVDSSSSRRSRNSVNKYSWLTGRVEPRSTAPKAFGVTLPRSREFSKRPVFSFGRDDRFSDRVFQAHKPLGRPTDTPGPIYDLASPPSRHFSFARDGDPNVVHRTPPVATPGPGSYNLRYEHRVEAARRDEEARRARRSLDEGAAPAPAIHDEEDAISFKFGDVPTRPSSPAFSFGTGDREARAKCYDTGELNKEMAGRGSPGPVTAHIELCQDQLSSWHKAPRFTFGGLNIARNNTTKQASDAGPTGRLDEPTSPKFGFGTAARDARVFVPNDDPMGPKYFDNSQLGVTAFGHQPASTKVSAPQFKFAKATRDKHHKIYMPRPSTN